MDGRAERARETPMRATAAMILAVALGSCPLAGCGGGDASGERAIDDQRRYAERFRTGVELAPTGRVWARSYDRDTLRLADVRVDAGAEHMLHADFADILVDPASDTIRLRLAGVISADTESESLRELAELTTEAIPLGVDVVP
jgi:hypothetical protein